MILPMILKEHHKEFAIKPDATFLTPKQKTHRKQKYTKYTSTPTL